MSAVPVYDTELSKWREDRVVPPLVPGLAEIGNILSSLCTYPTKGCPLPLVFVFKRFFTKKANPCCLQSHGCCSCLPIFLGTHEMRNWPRELSPLVKARDCSNASCKSVTVPKTIVICLRVKARCCSILRLFQRLRKTCLCRLTRLCRPCLLAGQGCLNCHICEVHNPRRCQMNTGLLDIVIAESSYGHSFC